MLGGPAHCVRVGEGVGLLGLHYQRGSRALGVQQLGHPRLEALPRLGQPHRLDVAAQQGLVAQVEARGRDRPGHHVGRAAEVVLVVGVAGGAVGEHQRWLARATGPAAALGVVRGRRRHIPQTDRVQARDVDAQFHGRRAVQQRERALAEGAFAFLALHRVHLGGVFAGGQAAQLASHLGVEGAEEGVDAAAGVGVHGLADRVGRRGRPVARGPHQRGRPEPVTPGAVDVHLGEDPGPGQHVQDLLDEPLRVVGVQRAREPRELVRTPQVAPHRRSPGQVQVVASLAGAAREREDGAQGRHRFIRRHRPHAGQLLLRLTLDALEPCQRETADVYGEHLAELVEDDPAQLLAMPVARVPKRLRCGGPQGLISGDLRQRLIADPQQSGLFEVGHGDPPAALQVEVQAVLDELAQRLLRTRPSGIHGVRGCREIGELKAQRVHHPGRHHLVSEPARGVGHGLVQRAAQLGDLDEVIEVAGLQTGVLPVVDEREQLACIGREFIGWHVSQGAHQAGAQDGDRRATAFGVQGDELGEIATADLLVTDLAGQTESEWGRDERRCDPADVDLVSCHIDPDPLRQVLHLVRQGGIIGADPGVGQAALLDRIRRPGEIGRDVEVAVHGVAGGHVPRRTGRVRRLAAPGDSLDHGVLLAALAAEGQREQQLLRGRRHSHLILRGDVAGIPRFEGNVKGIPLGQELVEPERKQRPTRLGIAHPGTGEQRLPDRVVAVLDRDVRRIRQGRRRVLLQPPRRLPDEAASSGFGGEPER